MKKSVTHKSKKILDLKKEISDLRIYIEELREDIENLEYQVSEKEDDWESKYENLIYQIYNINGGDWDYDIRYDLSCLLKSL